MSSEADTPPFVTRDSTEPTVVQVALQGFESTSPRDGSVTYKLGVRADFGNAACVSSAIKAGRSEFEVCVACYGSESDCSSWLSTMRTPYSNPTSTPTTLTPSMPLLSSVKSPSPSASPSQPSSTTITSNDSQIPSSTPTSSAPPTVHSTPQTSLILPTTEIPSSSAVSPTIDTHRLTPTSSTPANTGLTSSPAVILSTSTTSQSPTPTATLGSDPEPRASLSIGSRVAIAIASIILVAMLAIAIRYARRRRQSAKRLSSTSTSVGGMMVQNPIPELNELPVAVSGNDTTCLSIHSDWRQSRPADNSQYGSRVSPDDHADADACVDDYADKKTFPLFATPGFLLPSTPSSSSSQHVPTFYFASPHGRPTSGLEPAYLAQTAAAVDMSSMPSFIPLPDRRATGSTQVPLAYIVTPVPMDWPPTVARTSSHALSFPPAGGVMAMPGTQTHYGGTSVELHAELATSPSQEAPPPYVRNRRDGQPLADEDDANADADPDIEDTVCSGCTAPPMYSRY
ncbi:hypothetical protein C8Q80DRAFT_446932 [Daedaleopsis nitida]|nr:hypothetical protein C8Q80DRAFT_446932 [Daedaleopsis nitida]